MRHMHTLELGVTSSDELVIVIDGLAFDVVKTAYHMTDGGTGCGWTPEWADILVQHQATAHWNRICEGVLAFEGVPMTLTAALWRVLKYLDVSALKQEALEVQPSIVLEVLASHGVVWDSALSV